MGAVLVLHPVAFPFLCAGRAWVEAAGGSPALALVAPVCPDWSKTIMGIQLRVGSVIPVRQVGF